MYSTSYKKSFFSFFILRIHDLNSLFYVLLLVLLIKLNILFLTIVFLMINLYILLFYKKTIVFLIKFLCSLLPSLKLIEYKFIKLIKNKFYISFIYSLVERIMSYLSIICAIEYLMYYIDYIDQLLAIIVSDVTSMLPLNLIGSFGTFELSYSFVLFSLGFDKQYAFNAALGSHLLIIVYASILALFSYTFTFMKYDNN